MKLASFERGRAWVTPGRRSAGVGYRAPDEAHNKLKARNIKLQLAQKMIATFSVPIHLAITRTASTLDRYLICWKGAEPACYPSVVIFRVWQRMQSGPGMPPLSDSLLNDRGQNHLSPGQGLAGVYYLSIERGSKKTALGKHKDCMVATKSRYGQ